MPRIGRLILAALVLASAIPPPADAHPMVENALEVVISRDKVAVEMRVSMEQVMLVEGAKGAPRERWPALVESHAPYLPKHLLFKADGKPLNGRVVSATAPAAAANASAMAAFHLVYPLPTPPALVRIDQNLLVDFPPWTAPCVVRVRRSDQATFESALLTRETSIEYPCEWPTATSPAATAVPASQTTARFWSTFGDYVAHGVGHIIGPVEGGAWRWRDAGIDHLLFAAALVLATTRLWELVKVVSAFTLAHTITLTLSVLDKLPSGVGINRVVEPMIAASIVFVALQNVFWPRASKGSVRLAIAFGFGLFHGLGFAGGLKDAMTGMPGTALGAALGGFSIGVEIGHQIVVIPLFAALYAVRNFRAPAPRVVLYRRVLQLGSIAISVGGAYFLVHALGN